MQHSTGTNDHQFIRARLRRCLAAVMSGLITIVSASHAANIVWVSDSNDPATGFFPGALPGQTDSAWVTLLQNAGHNVIRFNQPNAQGTLLTAAELAALNTNDLIIISRAVNSGAFQPQQGDQWNIAITAPLIDMSPYHVRTDGPNRLGWFAGNSSDNFDDTPSPLAPVLNNPAALHVIDYLFGWVPVEGTNTAFPYTEPMDRNTSQIAGAPVSGGVVYATVRYIQQNNTATPPTMNNGYAIVGFPAGTAVRSGTNLLAGYRMFFAGGTRESSVAPNSVPLYSGRENLTPLGENVFLRAVQVAINNGVAPSTNCCNASISVSPSNVTVAAGQPVRLSVTTSGSPPRTVEWQRDDGSGTFTNIPGAVSVFQQAVYSLPSVSAADNGAQFRVVVSNAFGMATSQVATVTVPPDNAPPVALSAASFDGTSVMLCFDEPVLVGTATEVGNYQFDGDAIPITGITLSADGRVATLTLQSPMGATGTLNIFNREDLNGNASGDAVTLQVVNFGFASVDVGAVTPPGTNFTCSSNWFQVIAGGVDLGSTSDILRFSYKPVTGDFDARVRVLSFTGVWDHFETTAKAMLTARETTANNSAAVDIWTTPSPPGDNNFSSRFRSAAGGATNVFGPSMGPVNYPDAWMRILRVGNQFSTFSSADGSNWVAFGTNTIALAQTLNVGVGAVSHRSGRPVTATFSEFSIAIPSVPVRLVNWSYNGGTFSASFDSQSGVSYRVEFKDNLNTVPWTTLTTIAGDGTAKTFTDPGPASTTGSRFYRVVVE